MARSVDPPPMPSQRVRGAADQIIGDLFAAEDASKDVGRHRRTQAQVLLLVAWARFFLYAAIVGTVLGLALPMMVLLWIEVFS